MKCKDRLHDIVKDEIETDGGEVSWKEAMEHSFWRMDKEVSEFSAAAAAVTVESLGYSCRCELQTPHCDAVGSTA
ncbi:hypothetical protein, partial [Salmonella sp. s58078]|uniref:hypothetical protein n=1 Tax=Salmonella sp. s58078 TaxID=3159699 RepID=UPI00398155A2